MRRRSILRLCAVGLAAALAVAVGADTPVRRWLVPPSEAATLAALDGVLAEVRIPPTPLPDAAARLGELAGVPIVVDWAGVADADRLRAEPVELDFTSVTLRDALQPFVHRLAGRGVYGEAVIAPVRADRGRLVVGAGPGGSSVRAYDVRPALPHDGAAAVPAGPARDALRSVPSLLAATEADALRLVERQAGGAAGRRPAGPRAVARRFGRYAVVCGTRDDHEGVEHLLGGLAEPGRRPRVRFPRVYDVSDLLAERVLWARAATSPAHRPGPPEGVADRARRLFLEDLGGAMYGRQWGTGLRPDVDLVGGRLVVLAADQSRQRAVEYVLRDLRQTAAAATARPTGP